MDLLAEDKMVNVYYSKDIERILDKVDYSKLGSRVAAKVHFGEKGCTTFINPKYARKLYDRIRGLGKEVKLVECNVLYRGSRTNKTLHLKTAEEHGFDIPIEILDGEHGRDFVEIQGCKIGKGIKNYDSLVVLTHFKGHMAFGFGGAIKNLGMGLGSRAGKLHMHSNLKPSVSDLCIACEACVENCNDKAISIVGGKAKIDDKACIGCAMCISVCKAGAVSVPWRGRTSQDLQKKIAEYAAAVLSLFPDAIFINVLENITANCDCVGARQKPVMKDVGILFSNGIVAVEQASLDLANKFSEGRFSRINSVDKQYQIKIAEELALGSSRYNLVEL
jgi:hypothetical protein